MKLCDDIISILEKMDEVEGVSVACVARNWKKMLKCNPKEMTDLSVAEKVASISAKFRMYDDALSEMRADILILKEKTVCQKKPLMSEVVQGKNGSSNPDDSDVCEQESPEGAVAVGAIGAPKMNPPRLNNPQMLPSADGFEVQRDERRRQQREANRQQSQKRKPVAGQSDGNGLRKPPSPTWHYFVYKVHKDDNIDEVREYTSKQGVVVRDLVKTSHNDAKYNSFKLSVPRESADSVLNPEFWPKGIYIRRWHERQQKGVDRHVNKAPTAGEN
jgi:hypothetical protein